MPTRNHLASNTQPRSHTAQQTNAAQHTIEASGLAGGAQPIGQTNLHRKLKRHPRRQVPIRNDSKQVDQNGLRRRFPKDKSMYPVRTSRQIHNRPQNKRPLEYTPSFRDGGASYTENRHTRLLSEPEYTSARRPSEILNWKRRHRHPTRRPVIKVTTSKPATNRQEANTSHRAATRCANR